MAAEGPLDIAVVGAGYAGLTTALFCQARGHRVTIFHSSDWKDSASYRGGGGMTSYNPPTASAMNEVRVNFLGVSWVWLSAFFWHFVVNEGSTKANIFALAQASREELKRIGIPMSDYTPCEAPGAGKGGSTLETVFYNNMQTMEVMRNRLEAMDTQFIKQDVASPDQLLSGGFDHVFMCRGAADYDKFESYVAVVAGNSTDLQPDTVSKSPCFEFASDESAFVSRFPDRDRMTFGAYFGYSEPPNEMNVARYENEVISRWHGARLNTPDTLPFYSRDEERVTYVNGGSFNGLFTYPAVSRLAVDAALGPDGSGDDGPMLLDFNASISRLRDAYKLGVVVLALFLAIGFLVLRWFVKALIWWASILRNRRAGRTVTYGKQGKQGRQDEYYGASGWRR